MRVVLTDEKSRRKNHMIHRLVALSFIPEISGKPHVNHKDSDKTNNDLSNLEWVDRRENCRHYQSFKKSKLISSPPLQGCRGG